MQVYIDGVQYVRWNDVPQPPSTWKLTAEHIEAVRGRTKAIEALLWAVETEATVQEMLAWLRAGGADEPVPDKPKKVAPLPVPSKKPAKLFD